MDIDLTDVPVVPAVPTEEFQLNDVTENQDQDDDNADEDLINRISKNLKLLNNEKPNANIIPELDDLKKFQTVAAQIRMKLTDPNVLQHLDRTTDVMYRLLRQAAEFYETILPGWTNRDAAEIMMTAAFTHQDNNCNMYCSIPGEVNALVEEIFYTMDGCIVQEVQCNNHIALELTNGYPELGIYQLARDLFVDCERLCSLDCVNYYNMVKTRSANPKEITLKHYDSYIRHFPGIINSKIAYDMWPTYKQLYEISLEQVKSFND